MKVKKNTPAKVALLCIPLVGIIICSSLITIESPILFVKILNLILLIVVSAVVGAFIREMFVLREKDR